MTKSSFGDRFRAVFGGARYAEIAEKMGVSEAAIKVYVAGRVPDDKKLLKIHELTKCNLHWLLTGEGPQFVSEDVAAGGISISENTLAKLRSIAHEQAPVLFGDAEVSRGNAAEERTLTLLIGYLLNDALMTHNVIQDPLMPAADWQRARRMSFVAGREKSIDDHFRSIIAAELQRLTETKKEEDIGGVVGPIEWGHERIAVPHAGEISGGEERLIGEKEVDEIRRRIKPRRKRSG